MTGLSVVENFTINVQDTNDAPLDILFFGSLSIQEDSQPGVLVCTASAVDEDSSQTHTYAINNIVGERYGNSAYVNYFALVSSYLQAQGAVPHY